MNSTPLPDRINALPRWPFVAALAVAVLAWVIL